MIWRIAIVLVGLGIGGLIFGFKERTLSNASSSTPETKTLKDLIARGAKGNPNIVLKDFKMGENFVYETGKYGSNWTKVWVPIIPKEEFAAGKAFQVRALIYSTNVKNQGELNVRCDRPELPGMVTNEISSLGSGELKLLKESYPSADFSTCIIFHEGRTPVSGAWYMTLILGGLVFILGGVGLLGLVFVQSRNQAAATPKKKKKKRVVDEEEDEEDDEEEAPRKRRRVEQLEEVDEDRPKKRRPREE